MGFGCWGWKKGVHWQIIRKKSTFLAEVNHPAGPPNRPTSSPLQSRSITNHYKCHLHLSTACWEKKGDSGCTLRRSGAAVSLNHRMTESAHCALEAAFMLNAVTKLYFMYIYIKRSREGQKYFMEWSLYPPPFFFFFFLNEGKDVVSIFKCTSGKSFSEDTGCVCLKTNKKKINVKDWRSWTGSALKSCSPNATS